MNEETKAEESTLQVEIGTTSLDTTIVDQNGHTVADELGVAIAYCLVHRFNSYPKLVEALSLVQKAFRGDHDWGCDDDRMNNWDFVSNTVNEALALTEPQDG